MKKATIYDMTRKAKDFWGGGGFKCYPRGWPRSKRNHKSYSAGVMAEHEYGLYSRDNFIAVLLELKSEHRKRVTEAERRDGTLHFPSECPVCAMIGQVEAMK